MSKRGTAATLSYMIEESASEDEFAQDNTANMLTSDSAIENNAPAKKRSAGKPAKTSAPLATKSNTAKARTSGRRTSGASVTTGKTKVMKKAPPPKRKALAERQEPNASDTEEVEDFENADDSIVVEQPVPTKKRGRPPKAKLEDESAIPAGTPEVAKKSKAAPKTKPKTLKKEESVEPTKIIPETQPELDPMDVEPSIEEITEMQEPISRPQLSHRVRSVSKQRQTTTSFRRGGSVASDTERAGSDPALRRKLGDMTKKFENLDMKYRNLREVSVRDTETNFDKLKRNTDERAKAQDDLIASLKKELATQRALAAESKSLRSQLSDLRAVNTELSSENKSLQSQLSESQTEIKSLNTKLAATRATSASVQSTDAKIPGSAVKAQRTIMIGSAEAAKEAQIRQLKEDLYSDLTGLIIRGVKRGEEEDVYDCIQTGRNGTLHFHLAIAADTASQSYEDAEFAYTPLLDENRDRDLLDILPDYLTEEICFPRSSAAKFYAKVVDCMTKRVVVEE